MKKPTIICAESYSVSRNEKGEPIVQLSFRLGRQLVHIIEKFKLAPKHSNSSLFTLGELGPVRILMPWAKVE